MGQPAGDELSLLRMLIRRPMLLVMLGSLLYMIQASVSMAVLLSSPSLVETMSPLPWHPCLMPKIMHILVRSLQEPLRDERS